MTKEEALTLALKQLEFFDRSSHQHECVWQKHLITAIKEALAQPEQEPLAYAGVKVWVGNQQVVRLLTQTELHYSGTPWLLVELNALKCVAALKEKNNAV